MIEDSILSHLHSVYPKEGCGIVYSDGSNIFWTSINNVSDNQREFVLDKNEYLRYYLRYKILCIVHSHPDSPESPSSWDIENCNAVGIPYIIYSIPTNNFYVLEPDLPIKPLLKRNYCFGYLDCFELIRDYYKTKGINLKYRGYWSNNWWEGDKDWFSDEHLKTYKMTRITSLEPDCFLTFQIGSRKANHCGVYTSNGNFIHHPTNRLSVEEPLSGIWKKTLRGIYRYG